jgi:carotenoid 1,2-hydratase
MRANHPERLQPAVSGNGRSPLRSSEPRLADAVSAIGIGQQGSGSLSGGGKRSSGAWGADGSNLGSVGGRDSHGAPRFDQQVGPGAYLWWYVDAISDDGQNALSIIAFVGSVFSPYYAWAYSRKGTAVNPENHCAINVALYGKGGKRWAMTERGKARVDRTRDHFVVGPSHIKWQHDHLQIELNEVCVPFPHRVRGTVRVYPTALSGFVAELDDAGRHRWGPIAACARLEVDLLKPDIKWQGEAYFDSNEGDEPVNRPFQAWDWSRSRMRDGSTAVLYDLRQTNGHERVIARRFALDGSSQAFEPPPKRTTLPKTLWRIDRSVRAEAGAPAHVTETLEDAPFYARSLLSTRLLGESVTSVHETLLPQRLNNLPVQLMLPWRMPRRA